MSDSSLTDVAASALASLQEADRGLLLDQTARILDRHAEIQDQQRHRAIRILQAYVAGVGVLITGHSIYRPFSTPLVTPGSNTTAVALVIAALLLMVSVALVTVSVLLVYEIPLPATEVLTPGAIEYHWITSLLTFRNRPEPETADARGGVRSVSINDEFADRLTLRSGEIDTAILTDRFARIEYNEAVINHNSIQLQNIYERITFAIAMTTGAILAFLGALALTL